MCKIDLNRGFQGTGTLANRNNIEITNTMCGFDSRKNCADSALGLFSRRDGTGIFFEILDTYD